MSRFRLTPDGRIQLSENDVRAACLDLLRARNWWPIRQHVGRVRTPDGGWISIGEAGDPDYAAIRQPSFFIEFKRPNGKLSKVQRKRIEVLKRCYGLDTMVIASVEDLAEWLDAHEKGRGTSPAGE